VGWDGVVKLGRWNLATAEFTLSEPGDCRLECDAADGDGHTATYVGPTASLRAGAHRLETPFQVGRPDSLLTLRIRSGERVLHEAVIKPGDALQLRPLNDQIIVSLGELRSVQALADATGPARVHVVTRTDPQQLPQLPAGYAAVDWLVLSGPASLSPEVSLAIRDWVAGGGKLVVSIPKSLAEFRQSSLRDWLPVRVAAEPISVRDVGALEAFAGRNVRIPMTSRVTVADVQAADGVSLASSRNDQLLLRVPYGFGEVLVLTLDITQPPLTNWAGLDDFTRRLVRLNQATALEERAAAGSARGQLTSTGITDLASQWGACLDYFPTVQRPSPWWSMVWILACVAVIGPLDYLVVHRLLKRPHYTWVTLPVSLVLFVALAANAGSAWNQSAARLNRADVVDFDVSTATTRVPSFATYYSPSTARISVSAEPGFAGGGAAAQGLNWFYFPEATIGGLYRPAGAEWGRTGYQIEPARSRIDRMPVLQWSSRTVAARWLGTVTMPIDSNLQSTGLGRLTGTLTHRLPGRISNWVLAYGNRAYWLQPSRTEDAVVPWPAGQRLSLEDPLMFQGDLRGLLTRTVATSERGKSANDTRIRLEQTRYDSSARDPFTLWQMVTFHEAAGGTQYTGLANQWLDQDDLSRQLDLGRAVLFGRLEGEPWAAVRVNDAELPADRNDVYVRVVLPVRRSGEIVRELPKFDKDGQRVDP
jgi:hypothetical protein